MGLACTTASVNDLTIYIFDLRKYSRINKSFYQLLSVILFFRSQWYGCHRFR